MRRPQKIHDVGARESWDKIVLLLAFVAGVGGGIALKVLGVHPFITAGYSAAILTAYAVMAYTSTALRLEPEVIGDNAYYLGFLFTLTSLSVTLYFVIEAGAEDRAKLIPEVISGFGVALVSTIVGVFIRVLMMQFRLDIVSRERETRVEIDEAARRLRTEMIQALQQMKLFGVESMQHAAEREQRFADTTDRLVEGVKSSLGAMSGLFYQELQKTVREQTTAAVEAIRSSVQGSSEGALRQMGTSFEELAHTMRGLSATQATARGVNEQANAALHQQTNQMTDLVGQLSRRIRSVAEEVESSGAALSRSFTQAAVRLDQSLSDTTRRLDTGLQAFDEANRASMIKTEVTLSTLTNRLASATAQVEAASAKLTEEKPA
ncbi:hypothetical protein NX862_05525 [Rhodobacter sp. KR11]|jgi:uncharacterized protein YoxC|uniref:hypothetical protein n=1 Tax=Rhodobacter sp. KR11 TaxID=2974588 RepID=UPI00222268DB|nr:hypothetical protein [Rhodobacter sp. KR11]MCW1918204.1 hypothetical protein [Rhodobacter sp. KR11]